MAVRTISNAGGNWSATSTWVEGVVPLSSDDVVATATSGALTVDSVSAVCLTLDLTNYVSTLTFAANTELGVFGSTLKLSPGMTLITPVSCILRPRPTAGIQNVTTFGKTIANFNINAAGAIVKLLDGLSATTVTHNFGTFDTNGQTCTWGSYSSNNSNTRTLTLGASNITITGTGVAWDMTVVTGQTTNAGTSTITFTGANATFTGGGRQFYNVAATGSGTFAITNTTTYNNLTRIGTAVQSDTISIQSPQTVNGVFTMTGNSPVNRLVLTSSSLSSQRTIALGASGTVSLTNVDIADILFTGTAAPVSGTMVGDLGGNSGITVTAPTTQAWQSTGSGNYSDITKWTSRVPLPQDTATFPVAFVGTPVVTMDFPRVGTIDASGAAGTWSMVLTQAVQTYGSIIFPSSASFTAPSTSSWTLTGRGNYVIDMKSRPSTGLTLSTVGGTYTLASPYVASGPTRSCAFNYGTFDTAGFAFSTGLVSISASMSASRPLVILGRTSSIILTGTGIVWNDLSAGSVNATFSLASAPIAIADTSATAKTFAGGSRTYGNVTITGGGSGAVIFTGANTFGTLAVAGSKTITMPAGVTTTVASLTVPSNAGQVATLASSTPGTQWTLASSGRSALDYASITDSVATGGGTFFAGHNSTNGGNNTGWTFASLFTLASGLSGHGDLGISASRVAVARSLLSASGSAAASARAAVVISRALSGAGTLTISAARAARAAGAFNGSLSVSAKAVACKRAAAAPSASGSSAATMLLQHRLHPALFSGSGTLGVRPLLAVTLHQGFLGRSVFVAEAHNPPVLRARSSRGRLLAASRPTTGRLVQ